MPEYLKFILLFIVGSIAGFINVNAGGGSTITLPVLIFLGLESAIANGTNRIGILLQNIFAVLSFRQQEVHRFKSSFLLALFTLPGAIFGAYFSIRISNEWFQRILAIVMIGIVFSIIFTHKNNNNQSIINLSERKWLIYPALFGIGFYGGFIQVGVGFILMAALYHVLKISLVYVNMHKVFIVFVYTLPVLCFFIWTGNVNWVYGLSLGAGTAVGAWWGARAVIKGGEKVIRYILAGAILLMSIKLLGIF